ncbi:MAG: shikimate kinase [Lachnospiraceae bacterium]|nr:shikimate kinase [Lachnospiraceae bacterium]
MPGSGKSTVGVVLAKNIGYDFLDSDLVIQAKENKKLHEIISEKGLEDFLKIEEAVNASFSVEHTVIATGGSAVYGTKAMEHLKGIGRIVYLKLPYEEIRHRLGDLNERGVAVKKDQTLKDLYDERVLLYEKYADIIIECFHKEIREIVAEIGCLIDLPEEK